MIGRIDGLGMVTTNYYVGQPKYEKEKQTVTPEQISEKVQNYLTMSPDAHTIVRQLSVDLKLGSKEIPPSTDITIEEKLERWHEIVREVDPILAKNKDENIISNLNRYRNINYTV